MLGLGHMEVEVQDREQVEMREKVEARETEEEDKTRKQQTLKHVMTCGWTCFMQTRRATPWATMWCVHKDEGVEKKSRVRCICLHCMQASHTWDSRWWHKQHTTRTAHTRIFSRAWLKRTSCIFVVCCLQSNHPRAQVVFRTLLDPAPLSSTLSTPTSSSLLRPPNKTNLCAPQSGHLFGRFARQSPLTSYEPNAPVEVSCTEVMTTLLPGRKERLDRLTTLAKTSRPPLLYWRWMKDRIWECWPHHCQDKRETSANPFRIYDSDRESSETPSSHFHTCVVKPVAMCSNKRKSSRD